MVVLSNLRLGPSVELLVADHVARAILQAIAAAARPFAAGCWEHELVRWLEGRAQACCGDPALAVLDVGEIAWTPDHFEAQRRFLLDAIRRAAATGDHVVVLDRWRQLIEAHPATSVQVGRRWNWAPTA